MRARGFVVAGVLVTLLVAGVVSLYASSSPDGLERVARDQGFSRTAKDHPGADGPMADYSVKGVEDDRLSAGLAGVAGALVVLLLSAGLFRVVRRRGQTPAGQAADDADGTEDERVRTGGEGA